MADYKINVELALTNTAFLAALTAISRHLGHIRTQQKDIEGGFRAWHLAAAGVTGLFISGAMAKGFADVTLAAKGVTEELIRMQMQGQKAADIQANWKEAFRVSGITGQPIEQVLSEMGKMSYYTADPEEARALSEKISKMEIVLQAVTGKESKGLVTPLLKALEEVGILGVGGREGDLAKMLELFTKDITATKGAVTPAQIGQNILYARAARFGWTTPEALAEQNPFVTSVLPYLIQSFGGVGRGGAAGPGAALMSMFTKNVQGTLSMKSLAEASKLGLLDPATIKRTKKGEIYEGMLKDRELYAQNPYEWVQRVLTPALKTHGITTTSAIIEALSKLYGTRMAADPAIGMALLGRSRLGGWLSPFERHMRAQARAHGIEEAFQEALRMPTIALQKMQTEWMRLVTVVGKALTPRFVDTITRVSDGLKNWGDKLEKMDPGMIAKIGDAFLSLTAGLAALSTVALGTGLVMMAGIPGLIAGLIAAIVAVDPAVQKAISALWAAVTAGDAAAVKAAEWKVSIAMWHSLNTAADNAFKGLMDTVRRFLGWIGMQGMGVPAEPPTPFMQRPWFRHRYQEAMPSTTKYPWEHMDPDDFPFHKAHPWFHLKRRRPEVEPWQPQLLPQEGEQRAGFSPYQRQPIFVIPTSGAQQNNAGAPWEPKGGGGGAVQINNVIYLDGQAVANAVHQYSLADMQYPRQAPAFDGRAGYTPPDYSPMSI